MLNEAERVRTKHLLTMEATITRPQLSAMHAAGLQPIVPRTYRARYAHASQASTGETDLLYPALAYKGGAIDVINLARAHVEPASNISAAICFKTMFGDIDIGLVLQWVGTYCVLNNAARQTEANILILFSPVCFGYHWFGLSFHVFSLQSFTRF